MNAQVYSDRARSRGCRAGGRSKAIRPGSGVSRGRPFPHFQTLQHATLNPAGDPKRFFEKTTYPVRIRAQFEPRVRRCYGTRVTLDFSLVKITGTDSPAFPTVGLEARVGPIRGRIRGAERWNLAGWDDVHRNPDRSSRPDVLLYCSRSWR